MRRIRTRLIHVILLSLLSAPAAASELRGGRIYDQGLTMKRRAEGAPQELVRAAGFLGQWDVSLESFVEGEQLHSGTGTAVIHFMNRGHALMERLHADRFGIGRGSLDILTFLVFNKTGNQWALGEANSQTENITVHNGNFDGNRLVLFNAIRRGGGKNVTHYRTTYEELQRDSFIVKREISTDERKTWTLEAKRSYKRREESKDFMAPQSDYGSPAPGVPEEARQFDFVVGSWKSDHELTFPNGRTVAFSKNDRAVHALNGHAIMEHSWFDTDPEHPDSATTIVRIYNRAMRRWECMYMANRANSILYFGGVQEGDRIVLHLFEADTSSPRFSYFVFHDIEKDSYLWHAETTADHGKTFQTTWSIKAVRNPPEE